MRRPWVTVRISETGVTFHAGPSGVVPVSCGFDGARYWAFGPGGVALDVRQVIDVGRELPPATSVLDRQGHESNKGGKGSGG